MKGYGVGEGGGVGEKRLKKDYRVFSGKGGWREGGLCNE